MMVAMMIMLLVQLGVVGGVKMFRRWRRSDLSRIAVVGEPCLYVIIVFHSLFMSVPRAAIICGLAKVRWVHEKVWPWSMAMLGSCF